MPRPRFQKLSVPKQELILEAAAREFAAYGYEQASLNQILSRTGLSKGAAYYYFDDKTDLFITAVSHYSQEMMRDLTVDMTTFTADNFWDVLTAVYRHQFQQARERPWLFGLMKAATSLPEALLQQEPLASFRRTMLLMLQTLLQQGQALGVVRTDLPNDLLVALVLAVDDAHDTWLLPHWPEMSDADLETAVQRVIGLLQRLIAESYWPPAGK